AFSFCAGDCSSVIPGIPDSPGRCCCPGRLCCATTVNDIAKTASAPTIMRLILIASSPLTLAVNGIPPCGIFLLGTCSETCEPRAQFHASAASSGEPRAIASARIRIGLRGGYWCGHSGDRTALGGVALG